MVWPNTSNCKGITDSVPFLKCPQSHGTYSVLHLHEDRWLAKNPVPINKISNKTLKLMSKIIFPIIFLIGKRLNAIEKSCKFQNAAMLDL